MNAIENRGPYIVGDELRIPYIPNGKGRVDVYQVTNTKDHEMTSWGVEFRPRLHHIAVKIDQMRLKGNLLRLSVRVGGREEIGLRVNYSEAQKLSSKVKISPIRQ